MLTDEIKYQQCIAQLEREVAELKAKLTAKQKATRYGLIWEDVPEAFEKDAENKIPILEEVKDKAIKNEDGKPTHILIEGDNYHALQCLNYTHRGKVDVIYIDPPYNTGSDGFTYKDKRFLSEFPNGTTIPKEHPLRHSTWLSFMSKRLELAKNLLSERGVIFISIDDNEQANLKLLCDKVLGDDNFVAQMIWKSKSGGANDTSLVASDHEYIVVYANNINKTKINNDLNATVTTVYNKEDENGKYALDRLDKQSLGYQESLDFPIIGPDGKTYVVEHKNPNNKKARWRWGKDTVAERYSELVFIYPYVYTKNYEHKNGQTPRTILFDERFGRTRTGTTDLSKVLDKNMFNYPKPTSLIYYLEQISTQKSSIILDFFAGSGTTLHATMKLNAEDGGNRQCILVQQKEGDKNICESVTYERNKRVMQGYTNTKGETVEGLGNSLKYYRTAFVGNHDAATATDEDKVVLAHKAGCLIAIAENTLDEVEANTTFQIFQDGTRYTAVYFSGNLGDMPEFTEKLESLRDSSRLIKIEAYIYCLGNVQQFENEFNSLRRINLHAIPQPIIEIYKQLNA